MHPVSFTYLVDGLQNRSNQLIELYIQRYSARFYGHTLSTLYLGSGTVFNEVHVWKVTEKNEEGFAPVQHRLVGHDGVIFGIRFSDDGSLLVSVSDDRTIRVWGLKDQKR
jgi:WD40 repeat protein